MSNPFFFRFFGLFLKGFFNALRTELTAYPGIIISNICPGPVQSSIVKNALTEEVTKVNIYIGDDYQLCICYFTLCLGVFVLESLLDYS